MRLRRLVLLGLLTVAAVAVLVLWSWIDAQRRAVVVFSTASSTPVLSWAVRVLTDEPRTEETVIGGAPATVVRTGAGRRPAVVLFPGTAAGGRTNPDVLRLARSLARAGYLVVVPELPGLADGEIVDATVQAARDVALETAHRDDVRGGEVALAGAWGGATLALLAAEDPLLAPRVSVVAGVAPWAGAANMLRLATTGSSLDGGLKTYGTEPLLTLTAARSLVAALQPTQARSNLLTLLRGVPPNDPDPLRIVRGLDVGNLPPGVAAVVGLLANTSPAAFDGLYAALPEYLRAEIERLSPLLKAAQLESAVELATAGNDRFVPAGESRALRRASPHVHLTVTGAVRGGLPTPSLGDALGANGFLVRALRDAG